MALINIDNVLHEVKRKLKSCAIGGGLELMSYKRNRTIAIVKEEDGRFFVIENGYEKAEQLVVEDELLKKLKPIIKREFPRSRKIRIFKFSTSSELERIHQKI